MPSQAAHEDHPLMPALALALVSQPRASLQELARAAGVSKATLYRCAHTREQLFEQVVVHALRVLDDSVRDADLRGRPLRQALNRLTDNVLVHRELTLFLLHYWRSSSVSLQFQASWEREFDAFFLRGQKEGVFRVDIPAPALTEIYASTLTGLIDAEHRGRVARVGLAGLVEAIFLGGAIAH